MKTSELIGPALNWAAAKCEEYLNAELTYSNGITTTIVVINEFGQPYDMRFGVAWRPSTDWSQGGPIIERERITIRYWNNTQLVHAYMPSNENWYSDASSPLIAAMRAYVASKLGDEVEIPEELL